MTAKPNRYLWLPTHAFEAARDLQHRVLAYDISPGEARDALEAILSPYLDRPLAPTDRVEILLKDSKVYSYAKGARQ